MRICIDPARKYNPYKLIRLGILRRFHGVEAIDAGCTELTTPMIQPHGNRLGA